MGTDTTQRIPVVKDCQERRELFDPAALWFAAPWLVSASD